MVRFGVAYAFYALEFTSSLGLIKNITTALSEEYIFVLYSRHCH